MHKLSHELETYTTKTNGPWHIRRGGRIVGPYTRDQIMDFATSGKILSGDCLQSSEGTWTSFDDPQIVEDPAIANEVVHIDTNMVRPASKARKSSALPNWISFILTKVKSIISRLNIDQTLANGDHLAVEGVEFTVIEQFLDYISSGYQGGNTKYKGDVFEALSKYYLENHPDWKNRFRAVWLWSERPSRYQWGGIDKGVDIIAESHEGFLWAIQCKGYKLSNAVNHGDIASFLAESSRPEVHMRLLMTTTDKIGKHAEETIRNQQIPVQILKRTDFQRRSFRWPARLNVKGKTVEFQPAGLASGQGLSKNRRISLHTFLVIALLLSCCLSCCCLGTLVEIFVPYIPPDTTGDIVSEQFFSEDHQEIPLNTVIKGSFVEQFSSDSYGEISSAGFSADGTQILISTAHCLKLINSRDGEVSKTLIEDAEKNFIDADFSPNNDLIVSYSTSSSPRAVEVWDAHNGKLVRTLLVKGKTRVVSFSEDGNHIFTGSADKIEIWDAYTGKLLHSHYSGSGSEFAVSQDGSTVAIINDSFKVSRAVTGDIKLPNRSIHIRDVVTGEQIYSFTTKGVDFYQEAEFKGIALSPSGKSVASRIRAGFLDILDGRTGQLLNSLSIGKDDSRLQGPGRTTFRFSPDWKYVAVQRHSSTMHEPYKGYSLHIWDVETGKKIHANRSTGLGLDFDSTGRRLVITNNGKNKGTITVYKFEKE
jgi:hypothetical protein